MNDSEKIPSFYSHTALQVTRGYLHLFLGAFLLLFALFIAVCALRAAPQGWMMALIVVVALGSGGMFLLWRGCQRIKRYSQNT